jgi:hypothetical protein
MEENLKKTLAENGVDKVYFYTHSTNVLQNVYTTCLLINTEKKQIEARGVAICSICDAHQKAEGKNKAFGRAMQALLRRKNDLKIRLKNRNQFYSKKKITVKSEQDKENFKKNIFPELKEIPGDVKMSIAPHGKGKQVTFYIPSNYPLKIANKNYKYKSQYRPKPAGSIEVNYLKSL